MPQIPASLGVSMLANIKEFVSLPFSLLNELWADGHDISVPWDETVAMREEAMEESIYGLWAARFAHAFAAGNK